MKELSVDLVGHMKDLLKNFQDSSSIEAGVKKGNGDINSTTENSVNEKSEVNNPEGKSSTLLSSSSISSTSAPTSSSASLEDDEVRLQRQLKYLEELEDLTENIDMAQTFVKIGGVDILFPYIEQYLLSVEEKEYKENVEENNSETAVKDLSLDLVLGILPILSMVSQNNPAVQDHFFPPNEEGSEQQESKIIRSLCTLILSSAKQIQKLNTVEMENDKIGSNSSSCFHRETLVAKLEKLQFKALGALSCLIRGHETAEKIFFNMRHETRAKLEPVHRIDQIEDKLSVLLFSTLFTHYQNKSDHLLGGKVNESNETDPSSSENSMRSRILRKSFFFLQALIACDYVGFDISVPIVQNLLSLILSFLDSKDDVVRESCQDLVTRYNSLIFTMVMSNPQITVTPPLAGGYSDQLKETLLIKCQVMKRILMKKKNSTSSQEEHTFEEEIKFWEDFDFFLQSSSASIRNTSTSNTTMRNTVNSSVSNNSVNNNRNDTTTDKTTTTTEESPILMIAPPTMTGAPSEP